MRSYLKSLNVQDATQACRTKEVKLERAGQPSAALHGYESQSNLPHQNDIIQLLSETHARRADKTLK